MQLPGDLRKPSQTDRDSSIRCRCCDDAEETCAAMLIRSASGSGWCQRKPCPAEGLQGPRVSRDNADALSLVCWTNQIPAMYKQ